MTFYKIEDPLAWVNKAIPIGRPNDNVRLYVVDGRQRLLPIGVAGELCIGGSGVGLGYLNQDDLTAEKFITNPYGKGKLYKTGDLVRYLDDGNLVYLGRRDFQVKLRGLRIELGEIEAALTRQQGIEDSLVTVVDERIVAYVVSQDAALDKALLRSNLKEYLPDYMVPGAFVALAQWPLTPHGKIDRRALVQPEEEQSAYVAPRDDVERQLVACWEQVLDVKPIGIKDDFFALGGHSLLAVRLLGLIRQHFKGDIALSALFQAATVEQLAALIRGDVPGAQVPLPVVLLQPQGERPPLFCVHAVGGNAFAFAHLARFLPGCQCSTSLSHFLLRLNAADFLFLNCCLSVDFVFEFF